MACHLTVKAISSKTIHFIHVINMIMNCMREGKVTGDHVELSSPLIPVVISKFVNIPKDSQIVRHQIDIRMGVMFLKWRSKVQIVQKLLLWKITGMKMAIIYSTPMHL